MRNCRQESDFYLILDPRIKLIRFDKTKYWDLPCIYASLRKWELFHKAYVTPGQEELMAWCWTDASHYLNQWFTDNASSGLNDLSLWLGDVIWSNRHWSTLVQVRWHKPHYPNNAANTTKLTGPRTLADKKGGPVKLLCIIMFDISKIRPKSILGPVKAQKFSRCLMLTYYPMDL